MKMEYLVQIIFIGFAYYLFSNEFFRFASGIKDKHISYVKRIIAFLLVYGWFMFASFLELPLIINWLVFLFLLGILVHVSLSFDVIASYALSMFCTITGLAMNIFFRSLTAILMNVPLNVFDNTANSIKHYPILLGFLFMGFLFMCFRYSKTASELRRMLENRESMYFYCLIEICIYLFLIIQLLAYSQSDNEVGIKVWGIKAAVFSIIALVIANIYTLRVASLHLYMDKQHEIHNKLIQEKEDINKFWELAYTDMLTSCGNRQLLDKRLEEYAGYGGMITLAFIDLNGLKIVNDQYGHLEGDQYLITATKLLVKNFTSTNADLFRYGGDEFVLMSNSMQIEEMEHLLMQTNEQIKNSQISAVMKSISYGVVQGNSVDYHELMQMADEKMYEHKVKYYEHMARI